MGTLNLGPGPAASSTNSPFVISDESWSEVAQYVDRINSMAPREVTTVTGYIAALPDLRSASHSWTTQTFPDIVALATKIHHYGNVVAPENLNKLKNVLSTPIKSAEEKTSMVNAVDSIMGTLRNVCRETTQSAGLIKTAVEGFVEASQQSQAQYQKFKEGIGAMDNGSAAGANLTMAQFAEEIAENIAHLVSYLAVFKTAPLVIVEKIKGDWGAIDSDLSYTQTWLQQRIDTGQPFLADLQIESAIDDWQKVADEAQAFINAAPTLK